MSTSTLNPDMIEINRLLQEGIQAARNRQREHARRLLMQVVELDQGNIQAWLWLSGVVDSPEDRQICLENVLSLDPKNSFAQKGLAMLRQKAAAPLQAAPAAAEPSPSPPPPGSGRYKRLEPAPSKRTTTSARQRIVPDQPAKAERSRTEVIRPAASPPPDKSWRNAPENDLKNEYQCSFCASPTQPDDKKCPACRNKLWIYWPRHKETSTLYKILLFLQGANFLLQLLTMGLMIMALAEGEERASTIEMVRAIVVGAIPLGYYGLVMFGFYKRWRIIFYLYLVQAVLTLGIAGFAALMLSLNDSSGFFCGGCLVLVALFQFFLVMGLGEDFTFDRARILLQVDSDVATTMNLLQRGNRYGQRKMWALAALHFRQAVSQMPKSINARLALGTAYLELKWFDKAQAELEAARQINADDPLVETFEKDLQKKRKVL